MFWGPFLNTFLSHFYRKQCIELEQQFDFLKDLVASVPDMQGDGEDNHTDGDKGPRRWVAKTRYISGKGQGHKGWGWLGGEEGERVLCADGLYLPEGAGNQAAVAGKMEAQEAKAKTKSCPGQTQNRR